MVDTSQIGIGILDASLTLIGLAFPEVAPFIVLARDAAPALVAAQPYIKKAVADGESAFLAAASASPGLGAKIEAMAKQIPMASGILDWATHLDNVTKAATPGFAVHGWTDQETQEWLDRSGGVLNDSRNGSG